MGFGRMPWPKCLRHFFKNTCGGVFATLADEVAANDDSRRREEPTSFFWSTAEGHQAIMFAFSRFC